MHLQETMNRAFDVMLDAARDGSSDTICLDADFGPGTDQRMQRVAAVPHITTICLEMTDVTDDGIRQISRLPRLKMLIIFGGEITDKGVNYLAGKRSIQTIVLDHTLVTEAGISRLKTLPNLRLLVYYEDVVGPMPPGVAERRIDGLMQLDRLETIKVGGNWISDEMIRDLQKSLPRVKVGRLAKNGPRPYWPPDGARK